MPVLRQLVARRGPCHRHNSEAGFTLVELLVVLVILTLLASIAVPRVAGYLDQSRIKTARIQMAGYLTALDLFRLDMGRYPNESEGLAALVAAPIGQAGWNGPYIDRAIGFDPWGTPYQYHLRSQGVELRSLGADGKAGGDGTDADFGP